MGSRRCDIPEPGLFWEEVLRRIEERRVVPVVGRDLLDVPVGGVRRPLYPWLAETLARELRFAPGELPETPDLDAVVGRYRERGDASEHRVHRALRRALSAVDGQPVPAALEKLAAMEDFKLYVTTTFDSSMRRAVDEARFDGQRQTLLFSYAPSDKQDLPREFDRVNRPAVFHLTGRWSGTPHSYAVTAQESREFLHSLESKTEDAPNFLLDTIRRDDLLVLGSREEGWITRHVVAHSSGGRRVELEVGPWPGDGELCFLQHVGGGLRVYRGRGASGFVDELYRRWEGGRSEGRPDGAALGSASSGTAAGSVFVSHVEADAHAARALGRGLDRAGVDVVLDADDRPLDPAGTRALKLALAESSVFVPILSRRALNAERRWRAPEWEQAVVAAGGASPSDRFVLPVAIDDTAPSAGELPAAWRPAAWTRLPEGRPTPEFVRDVVGLQRRYRSASLA